jgi:hypothetical protein
MRVATKEIYRSPNGDCWLLGRDPESGSLFVRHEANAASGGYSSDMELGEFLARSPRHPEHDALLRLIGTLLNDSTERDRSRPE